MLREISLAGMLTIVLFSQAPASDNTGTVEFGFDLSVENKLSNASKITGVSSGDSIIEFPLRVRVGTFLTEATLLETHLNLKFFSDEFEVGGSLGFTYHFESEKHAFVPYLGAFGALTRQQTRFGDREHFGLGLKLGAKTLQNRLSPRIEVFVLRRFKNIDFQSDVLLGLNIGLSVFFKSISAWDK